MKNAHTIVMLSIILGVGFLTGDAYAAGFVKFDGIEGESTDQDHKGWINLLSFSESLSTLDESTTSRTRGDTTLEDVMMVKELDKSSTKLAEAILVGKTFPKVEIHWMSDEGTYFSYELANVIITSYSISGDADERPTEQVSLNFEKIIRKAITDSQTISRDSTDGSVDKSIPATTVNEPGMKLGPKVPVWVQTTAQFWVDRNVSDREFTDALGFLVKERIIEVEVEPQLEESGHPLDGEPEVPAWIATTTKWWIDGEVPEDQFLEGIKWMIKNKIIRGL